MGTCRPLLPAASCLSPACRPPTSPSSPAKLRLAFEAAPWGLLVEAAGGKTSDGTSGGSILDVKITAVDQRTALCIGSSNEVDRFNDMICMVE